MKKIALICAWCLGLTGCSRIDYLADVTKDVHSGCFTASTNYLGFTENVTYVHLGDNSAAVNASPSCSGITQSSGVLLPNGVGVNFSLTGGNGTANGVIPSSPAPVGKPSSP